MAVFCFSGLYRLDRLHFIVCFNVARFWLRRTQLLQSCRGTGAGDSSEAFILAGYSAASLVLLPGGSPTNCSLAVLKNYFIASFSFELNITSVCGVVPLSCRFLLPSDRVLGIKRFRVCRVFLLPNFCYNSIRRSPLCINRRVQKVRNGHISF